MGRLRTEADVTRQPMNEQEAVLAWVALSSLRVVCLMRASRGLIAVAGHTRKGEVLGSPARHSSAHVAT